MEKKNRFSYLLERLMLAADLKNYTLAMELQYDVSYISKWVSGKVLPAEKSSEKVLRGISRCIVDALSDTAREKLCQDYQVFDMEDLERAIYDHLEAEYNYVKGLTKSIGTDIAPKTLHFASLTLPQFAAKMHHPALRNINSLNVVAAMDILSMEREYRFLVTQMSNQHMPLNRELSEVHYSLMLNLEIGRRDYIYDSIFLINMLSDNTNIDFNIYECPQAYGKLIFAVKDSYCISGMLIGSNRCLSVTISEEEEFREIMYERTSALCHREMLLFRKTTMDEMLLKYDYIQSMLSPDLRWLIGRMTEHFLSDDLFEEVLEQVCLSGKWAVDKELLRRVHSLTKTVLEESGIKIMIYESAFTAFSVSGEMDFYGHTVTLTTDQRLRYIQYMSSLLDTKNNLAVKMVHGRFVTDFQYSAKPCLFLSDSISYMRLDSENPQNNNLILNAPTIKEMFQKFYSEIWNHQHAVVIEDRATIQATMDYALQAVRLLSKSDSGNL